MVLENYSIYLNIYIYIYKRQAGCNPLATSLIADFFDLKIRGAAIGIKRSNIDLTWNAFNGNLFKEFTTGEFIQAIAFHLQLEIKLLSI